MQPEGRTDEGSKLSQLATQREGGGEHSCARMVDGHEEEGGDKKERPLPLLEQLSHFWAE